VCDLDVLVVLTVSCCRIIPHSSWTWPVTHWWPPKKAEATQMMVGSSSERESNAAYDRMIRNS